MQRFVLEGLLTALLVKLSSCMRTLYLSRVKESGKLHRQHVETPGLHATLLRGLTMEDMGTPSGQAWSRPANRTALAEVWHGQ
jgi:hypothetical protein